MNETEKRLSQRQMTTEDLWAEIAKRSPLKMDLGYGFFKQIIHMPHTSGGNVYVKPII